MSLEVLIAGAGIGGLTAGLALLRKGVSVRLFEQAAVLGDIGAGLQLAADGTRILIELGLENAMEAVVCPAAWKEVRLWDTGQSWKLFDLGQDSMDRFGAPYWFVHRGDLHRVLREAVLEAGGTIEAGVVCEGFSQGEHEVTLSLSDGRAIAGDALVGADGVHSRFRNQLFGASEPKYVGIVAWRGLVEVDRLPVDLRRPVGTNWVGPGGHIVTYPVRRGELLNIAAFCERSDWLVESWSTAGTKEEFSADFHGWNNLIHEIIRNVETPYKWALIGREALMRWTDHRVTLLGDACHPTLPFLAHGAIMALEDGLCLARCISSEASLPTALLNYERMRVDRARAIVDGSAANAKRFHNPILSDPIESVRYVEREWAPEKVRRRYDWLFEYDATSAPIGQPYQLSI
ncbi:FAD-dependent monooxygenase [Bradyrhizobium tropiciagri]|uniref:FAD-dependent monooxygenase n=1 Tax=Bradyrhizobium tropiciagri TaxID=312253 RepID=UPI00067D11A7|nr:FAD-dependent monooxygenase [Bradyrhizobium tropiciagri]